MSTGVNFAFLGSGAWIEPFATIVALLGVIASIWIARRGQKQDLVLAKDDADRAERAEKAGTAAAERAENAAGLTIDTMARMAGSLDRIAANGRVGHSPLTSALVPRVAWELKHSRGDTYMLTNIGHAVAHNVQLSAHESLLQPREWVQQDRLGVGEALTFMAARSMATSDSTITVAWSDPIEGESSFWRYPLPARPPRRS